jgi:hypothetical protein
MDYKYKTTKYNQMKIINIIFSLWYDTSCCSTHTHDIPIEEMKDPVYTVPDEFGTRLKFILFRLFTREFVLLGVSNLSGSMKISARSKFVRYCVNGVVVLFSSKLHGFMHCSKLIVVRIFSFHI